MGWSDPVLTENSRKLKQIDQRNIFFTQKKFQTIILNGIADPYGLSDLQDLMFIVCEPVGRDGHRGPVAGRGCQSPDSADGYQVGNIGC